MTAPAAPERALLERAFVQLRELRGELDAAEQRQREPIAIIGVGCRMPGGGSGPSGFWRVLRDGQDTVRPLPADRWDVQRFEATLRKLNPGGPSSIGGGFLSDVFDFDAQFFGVSPREAQCMDPQQRLMLEVCWEALEDAGLDVGRLGGSRTGVFAGVHSQSSDYFLMQIGDPSLVDAYSGTGTAHSVLSGRVAFTFDFRGPAISVDTACSSSLVAVHLACQSLRERTTDLALAGGVNLRLSPAFFLATSRMGTGSASGRCRVFDAGADGVVTGEGCGVVVLKRLSDALRDADPIWAVVRGSAVNQDGTSVGLAAPNAEAQKAVVREALQRAGVDAGSIGLVETHGTGTALGDPMEVEALSEVLGAAHRGRCALGAVKSNVGHLEGAAGIAGLIKAVLALKYETIPPNLHFERLNPHITFEGTPFFVPTTATPWPRGDAARCAGVSSFGWSGTNAHVVLEEAPRSKATARATTEVEPSASLAYPLVLSARSEGALRARAEQFATWLEGQGAAVPLEHLCWTAALRRQHFDWRLAVVGASHAELAGRLASSATEPRLAGFGKVMAEPKVVFVFPGQGSQWVGMARQLMAGVPSFRVSLEACERAFRPFVDWSLRGQLLGTEATRLEQIDCIQPCLFAIQVALAELWREWGVEPSAVVGHSMGEVAAAYVAGALTLDDAARIICRRSALLRRVSGRGAMVLLELGAEATRAYIGDMADRVSIAASNSPRSTVISGERAALETLMRAFERDQVFCRWIKVDVASHSPEVDPLAEDLRRELASVTSREVSVPIVSTVTGQHREQGPFDASYWFDNLRNPVRFADAVQTLLQSEHCVFLEVSPHPILLPSIEQCISETRREACALGSLRREQPEKASLLHSLADLHSRGVSVKWQAVFETSEPERRPCELPAYPWQHERFELPPSAQLGATAEPAWPMLERSSHPLLGLRVESSLDSGTFIWQSSLSLEQHAFLRDHQVGGLCVVPAAAYLDLARAAAAELWESDGLELEAVEFEQMLALSEGQTTTLQCVFCLDAADAGSFRVASRASKDSDQGAWVLHARGYVRASTKRSTTLEREAVLERCTGHRDAQEHYEFLRGFGLEYGPSFRGVESVHRGDHEALAEIRRPDGVGSTDEDGWHPAVLDACLQALTAARPDTAPSTQREMWLPVRVDRMRVYGPLPERMWCHAVVHATENPSAQRASADLWLYDSDGQLVAEVLSLTSERLGLPREDAELVDSWLYELAWQEQPLGEPHDGPTGPWLVFADRSQVSETLIRALEQRGERVVRVVPAAAFRVVDADHLELDPLQPDGYRHLLTGRRFANVVHLWSLELLQRLPSDQAAPSRAQACASSSVLYLMQALLRGEVPQNLRLWLVTAGCHVLAGDAPSSDPLTALGAFQAPLWGLARTSTVEHPELECTRIDLSRTPEQEIPALVRELGAQTAEDQVALRRERRYVARLERAGDGVQPATAPAEVSAPAAERAFRLELGRRGSLEGLALRAVERRPPKADEVEIEVQAAGLNFIDVLLALGTIPDPNAQAPQLATEFGGECSGRVVRVGADVVDLRVGQEVVAIAPRSMGTHVTTPARLVLEKPACLSWAQAAATPIAFCTAFWALHRAGRVQPGEKVLIHAAAGGVGLAAVLLCRQLGAEVFATAGNEEKRDFLRQLGVRHVMSSRSLDFAAEISRLTRGRGVDVVINSLSGAFIAKSLESLASYGRFVEIGKRDYYEDRPLRSRVFLRNLSFGLVDLLAVARERPDELRACFQEVLGQLANGRVEPLPLREFRLSEAREAFSTMAQARHIGKLVLSLDGAERMHVLPARVPHPVTASALKVHGDAMYLITGGLGGLGLTLAAWLVERGARRLMLIGRKPPDAAKQAVLDGFSARGVQVLTVEADVSSPEQLGRALERVDAAGALLRGVFHCAAVLDDATLLEQTPERFAAVMGPKLDGAWNLHLQTQRYPLDWYVMFSSGASLLGSPGQANYAAANAFLDALAHLRRTLGLPATSINWGPWARVGLAAESALRGERLAFRGLGSIEPEQGLLALERVLLGGKPQVGVLPLNLRQWRQCFPRSAAQPVLANLPADADASSPRPAAFAQELAQVGEGERLPLLRAHLAEQLAQVLRLSAARIDASAPFNSLGVDSLMALEFRNRLEASLGLVLPATLVWAHPSVDRLGPELVKRMGLGSGPRAIDVPQVGQDRDRAATLLPSATEDSQPMHRTLEALVNLDEREAFAALLDS